ncbi:MAG: glycosyltransferase family 2 protein [Planctomycetota bacterium]
MKTKALSFKAADEPLGCYNRPVKLSLVIPMRDEAEAFEALAVALDALYAQIRTERPDLAFRVILVDDGSQDATRSLAQSWQQTTALPSQILSLDPGRGLGAAISAGFDAATKVEAEFKVEAGAKTGDRHYLATADADLAYPLPTLLPMIEKLEEGYDLVSASPYIPGGRVEGVTGRRLWPSLAANAMHRFRFGNDKNASRCPHTFTCGFRVYRAALWPHIRPQAPGFLATTEFMVRALKRGARVAEIPETLSTRRAGQSKMKVLRTTFSHLRFAWRGPRS